MVKFERLRLKLVDYTGQEVEVSRERTVLNGRRQRVRCPMCGFALSLRWDICRGCQVTLIWV